MTNQEIFELMDRFERSTIRMMRLSTNGTLLEMSKDAPFAPAVPAASAASAMAVPAAAQESAEVPAAAASAPGAGTINAPLAGVFYAASAPGEAPFVRVGDRDCSIQRRNQKLIEEAPAWGLSDAMRHEMGEAAVRAAQAVGYESAGTVEFLLDETGEHFYFMEMNTRIRVEHGITEMITGVDLVREQLRIASGLPLSIRQEDIRLTGHAIECRINAEDPQQDFRPAPGPVEFIHFPGGNGVRVDSGLFCGSELSPYYDSLVAKVMAHGRTRLEAIRRMRRCLEEFALEGFATNAELSYQILYHPSFIRGNCNTAFLEENLAQLLELVMDAGKYREINRDVCAADPLHFPGYPEKLAKAREATGMNEAVLTATGMIHRRRCVVCALDGRFMMGSMGAAVGEKLTLAIEHAQRNRLPLIIFSASGGARMQEGILSLMQMAKTSAALKRFSEKGLLFISVLTDPTTGGVTASFASLGDVILAEPGALIGFAGPRVIEQTIGEKLPEDFQRAEFMMEHGFVDAVVERSRLRDALGELLLLHQGGKA